MDAKEVTWHELLTKVKAKFNEKYQKVSIFGVFMKFTKLSKANQN